MSEGLKLLGSIVDTGSIHTLRDLSADLFIEEEVELYNFMRQHYRRYGRIPAIATIEEELGLDIPAAEETTEYYLSRIYDRKLYNNLKGHYETFKDSMRNNDMEAVRSVIDEMKTSTRVIHTSSDIRSFQEAVVDVMREYDHAHENPGISGIPSGWPYFDYKVGGYQPGDLVTWVARPSMGKTYVMLKQALAAWQLGSNVLIVTMEMTIEQITRRLAAMSAGINPDFIRKGTLSAYAERRLRAYADHLAGADRLHLFAGGLRKRVSDVEIITQEYCPDITFIDGVYLMQPESKRQMAKTEKVSEVFDSLKQYTVSNNIPAVVTTQLSRLAGKKGKDSSLETVAFTDAISTHSSLVISLKEGRNPNQVNQRILEFLKGREGEAGQHTIHYTFSPMCFDEVFNENSEGEDGESSIPTTRGGQQANLDWMEP